MATLKEPMSEDWLIKLVQEKRLDKQMSTTTEDEEGLDEVLEQSRQFVAEIRAEKQRLASIEYEAKAVKACLEAKAREKQEKFARLNEEIKSLGLYIAGLQAEEPYTCWDYASYATLNRIRKEEIIRLKATKRKLIIQLANESNL